MCIGTGLERQIPLDSEAVYVNIESCYYLLSETIYVNIYD